MRLTVTIALAFLLVLGLPVASAKDTSTTEPAIDLSKIMGTWYVIARMPNPVERGHVTSRD
ncbi:MAG: lipocalin family protein, partial [Xanthomonas perforans]|nr:lipocalin family protein [Xanthomonas perforans]